MFSMAGSGRQTWQNGCGLPTDGSASAPPEPRRQGSHGELGVAGETVGPAHAAQALQEPLPVTGPTLWSAADAKYELRSALRRL
jgi:hypothetical protein